MTINVIASAVIPKGKLLLLREGKPVYFGTIGDPIEDAEFDCVALNPADGVRLKASFERLAR